MKKILYVTTVSSTINAFLIPHIQMLQQQGYQVDCACSINKEVSEKLVGVNIYEIPFTRNPLDLKNIQAFRKLIDIQQRENYDIVHVHTPIAALYGRLLKIKFPHVKTLYTVHGFHFYKGAPLKNWAIYYPIERIMAKFTDGIITMNEEDYHRALTFNVKETYLVNGVGIDLKEYRQDKYNKEEIRRKLNITSNEFVILMIGELNANKNHKQMIEAVEILKNRNHKVKVLCAGEGELFDYLNQEIEKRNLREYISLLGFRKDIPQLIAACDIGILLSYREGLPRNIMELMAYQKPVIGTDIRGVRDLIKHEQNGYLVNVDNSLETANQIEKLKRDREKYRKFGVQAHQVVQKYDINNVIKQLDKIYEVSG